MLMLILVLEEGGLVGGGQAQCQSGVEAARGRSGVL